MLAQASAAPTRMLASLPVRLESGLDRRRAGAGWSPVRLSLLIAWACLALAAVAVALLLHGALGLERAPGTFVSAVTHELRTPLTTFRLYTEMLDEGMVASPIPSGLLEDASRRGRPAGPSGRKRPGLRETGARPGWLTAARSFRPPRYSTAWPLGSLFAPARPAWSSSSARSTLKRTFAWISRWSIKSCRTWSIMRSSTRERGRPPHPSGRRPGGPMAGGDRSRPRPRLAPDAVRRLFRPFSKSAHDAAQSAPGVGLGLALSRRLARAGRRPAAGGERAIGGVVHAHDSVRVSL